MGKPNNSVSSYESLRHSLEQGDGQAMHGVNTGFRKARGFCRSDAADVAPDQVVIEDNEVYDNKDLIHDFRSGERIAEESTNVPFWRSKKQ